MQLEKQQNLHKGYRDESQDDVSTVTNQACFRSWGHAVRSTWGLF